MSDATEPVGDARRAGQSSAGPLLPDLARLTRAYLVASRVHADQRRRGAADIPYINHPAEVAHLVAEAGAPEDVVIAAILHDAVEDSDMSVDELRGAFGERVAELVAALTNPPDWDGLPKPEMKARQAEHVRTAAPEVKLIKIADQTSNVTDVACDPSAWELARAHAYLAGSALVVDACRGAGDSLEAAFDAALARARSALERQDGAG